MTRTGRRAHLDAGELRNAPGAAGAGVSLPTELTRGR